MAEPGMVILVGAGPGDPGLLTLAGRDAILGADVVLFDRLVGDGILAFIPEKAEKIDVGKTKGRHPVPQEEINRLLVAHAQAGRRVVRLKGGDPYLFGRGAEELEAAAAAGIPFKEIPGITSAIAVPAYAGIPVTHRDFSSSLHIITGHGKRGGEPDIPFAALARLKGTLVFLMSLSAADALCAGLIAAGMTPETPAALIENGARPNQRRLSATVATLAARAVAEAFSSPALIVVGEVCRLADQFDWTARLPLWGKRVLAVSSRESGGRLARALREKGCAVDEFAGIATEPLPAPESFWDTVHEYSWLVFTSQFGVECFFDAMATRRYDLRRLATARFAVVGARTASALEKRGVFADFIPGEYNGAALGKGLAERVGQGERVLLFRAAAGAPDLPEALTGAGIRFDDVPAYRTLSQAMPARIAEALSSGAYDAASFTSASSVESFAAALPEGVVLPPAVCIGDMTAAAARVCGMDVAVSREATLDALAERIEFIIHNAFKEKRPP